jgi:hypothetical protein
MNNNLWMKSNYLNKDIDYLSNVKIYEYDMKSGGFSILKHKGFFSESEIEELNAMDKLSRNIYIGKKLAKHPEWNKTLIEGFKEVIKTLFETYNIDEKYVLSIKKDAIFLLNINLGKRIKTDYVNFELKNTYTSYYYLNNVEFYYNKNKIDVKGISDSIVEKHKDFFLYDLSKIFSLVERNNYSMIVKYLKKYRLQYINKELDIESYKEFNREDAYLIELGSIKFYSKAWEELESVNISYNYLHYIKPLISFLI